VTPARAGSPSTALVAVVAGLALGVSFVDFRLWILPWLAVAPLIVLAERATPRRAFAYGMLAGVAGIAVAFSWLVYAFRVFGGFSTPVALAIYTAPVAWMAVQLGCFTGLLAGMRTLPFGLSAPVAFTAVEFVFPSLFPWRLAHTQYHLPVLLQTGELTGPSLLTFTIVWIGAALATAWAMLGDRTSPTAAQRRRLARTLLPAGCMLLALVGYGAWRLNAVRQARAAAPAYRVGVIQGNIGIERKGDRSLFSRNLDAYRALSRQVAPEVDLLIWPETVVQQHVAIDQTMLPAARNPFPAAPRPLLFGGLGIATDSGRRRLFNSAFLMGEDGRVLGRYDKRILVPFGEYMPFGDRFPRLRQLSPATSNFTAGSETVVLAATPQARLAALICYEDVIPGPAREAVAKGATLLVNLTNDAWYGRTAEPVQHQALAIWRALETRRDLVRATNTGLTSVIAASGDVLAELPLFEAAALPIEVRLLRGSTVYGAVGDLFAWTVVAAAVAAFVMRGRPS